MEIIIKDKAEEKSDLMVVSCFEDQLLAHKHPDLDRAISKKMFLGKVGELYATKTTPSKILFVGLGKKQDITLERVRRALGRCVKYARSEALDRFTTDISTQLSDLFSPKVLGQAIAEALLLANYSLTKYLSAELKEKKRFLKEVTLIFSGNKNDFTQGVVIGRVVAECANFVRDLVNEPANTVNSLYLEKVAQEICKKDHSLTLKVLNEADLTKAGMNALVGVNAGSDKPVKMLIVEYKGAGKEKWTALVGKGITFDSGGYNLKVSKGIEEMKSDMAGAAAVLGTIRGAAQLKLKKNILGVMPICENMISSKAQRPGDIVTAYNGKSIEIANTDAEGRLILADALAYTEDIYKPEVMIDMATLTGSVINSFGYYAAGLISSDQELIKTLQEAGNASGDRVWPMPFFEEYFDWMDGSISDLSNMNTKGKGGEAGAIMGAVFLSHFVTTTRWAHLDIAGSAYWAVEGDYLQKGGTGSGVRVMLYYFLNH